MPQQKTQDLQGTDLKVQVWKVISEQKRQKIFVILLTSKQLQNSKWHLSLISLCAMLNKVQRIKFQNKRIIYRFEASQSNNL